MLSFLFQAMEIIFLFFLKSVIGFQYLPFGFRGRITSLVHASVLYVCTISI